MTTNPLENRPLVGLTDLATDINREHQLAVAAAKSAVEHARRCGELLMEAKEAIGHGGFLRWLEATCDVSGRQARNYMRVAANWEAIQSKMEPGANLTIKGAMKLLAGPQDTPKFTASVDVYLRSGLINQGHAYQIARMKEWFGDTYERLNGDGYPYEFSEKEDLAVMLAHLKTEQSPPILLMRLSHEDAARDACTAFCERCHSFGWDNLPIWERHALWWATAAAQYGLTVDFLATAMSRWRERVYSAVFYTHIHPYEEIRNDDGLMNWNWWGYAADARHAGVDTWVHDPETYSERLDEACFHVIKHGIACPSEYQPWNEAEHKNYEKYHAARQ